MDNTSQQFCLKWHNHQTSLLSALPLLLDQSHLTDVTIVAEGKNLKAHRIILSSCSKFFFELFNSIEQNHHPVIVIPGASFSSIVALLTFMYSGEVNVFEEQIPQLLNLAETLGIKGLAEFQNNIKNSNKASEIKLSPQPKTPVTLENFFMKSFHLYPNLLPQPLNFSQSALNKTTELIEKYKNHCNLLQHKDNNTEYNVVDEKRSNRDIKNIDKIAETLRANNNNNQNSTNYNNNIEDLNKNIASYHSSPSPSISTNPLNFTSLPTHLLNDRDDNNKSCENFVKDENNPFTSDVNVTPSDNLSMKPKTPTDKINTQQQKVANSKLFATCFICHKQLSNQYNLRVHLETHQNVRYACNICAHVSRSKDALRKHVSYRHPGAPSLCESETRRKRKTIMTPNSATMQMTKLEIENRLISAQPNSPFIFMPNQFNANIMDTTNNNNNNNNNSNNNNNNVSTPISLPDISIIDANFSKFENIEHPKSS